MDLLVSLTDETFNFPNTNKPKFTQREAARLILFNAKGQIGLLYVGRDKYHKLPGGGIDPGESWQVAAVREAAEEMGAQCCLRETVIGKTHERRSYPDDADAFGLEQYSYCCVADVVGELGELERTASEIEKQQMPMWVPFDEALERVSLDKPAEYAGHFIQARDLALLTAAKRTLAL